MTNSQNKKSVSITADEAKRIISDARLGLMRIGFLIDDFETEFYLNQEVDRLTQEVGELKKQVQSLTGKNVGLEDSWYMAMEQLQKMGCKSRWYQAQMKLLREKAQGRTVSKSEQKRLNTQR